MVGNPLPARAQSLPKAKVEAKFVAKLLSREGFEVHALMATKADVRSKIEGAKWAHLACHGDLDKKALMLAEKKKTSSSGKKHTPPQSHNSDQAMDAEIAASSVMHDMLDAEASLDGDPEEAAAAGANQAPPHTLRPKKGKKKTLKLGAGKMCGRGGGGGGKLRSGPHDGRGAGERAYGGGIHRGVDCVHPRAGRDRRAAKNGGPRIREICGSLCPRAPRATERAHSGPLSRLPL